MENQNSISKKDIVISEAQKKYGSLQWKINISQKKKSFNPKLTIELWYEDCKTITTLKEIKAINFNPFYTFSGYKSSNGGCCSHNTSSQHYCVYSSAFIGERIDVPFAFANPWYFNDNKYPQFKPAVDGCATKIRLLHDYHINLLERTVIILYFDSSVNWSELYSWVRDNICLRVSDEFNERLLNTIRRKKNKKPDGVL